MDPESKLLRAIFGEKGEPSTSASPAPLPKRTRRLSDGSKAQIQLTADFWNGIALNLQAVGFLGFLAALIFTTEIPAEKVPIGLTFAIVCFIASWALHFWAAAIVKGLDQ